MILEAMYQIRKKFIKFIDWAAVFLGIKPNDWEVGLLDSLNSHLEEWNLVAIPFGLTLQNSKRDGYIYYSILDNSPYIPGGKYSYSLKAQLIISKAIRRLKKRENEATRKEAEKKSEEYIIKIITNFS